MSAQAEQIGAVTRFMMRVVSSKPGTWLFLNVITDHGRAGERRIPVVVIAREGAAA